MTTPPQHEVQNQVQNRVAHPLWSYHKGWVIERTGVPGERFCSLRWSSETVSPLHNRKIPKPEVERRIPTKYRLSPHKFSLSSTPYSLFPTPCLTEVEP
jgi:hypothetical protein